MIFKNMQEKSCHISMLLNNQSPSLFYQSNLKVIHQWPVLQSEQSYKQYHPPKPHEINH